MTTFFNPPNIDLHQLTKITIQTSNHNGGDQQDPDDDFFVTKISFVRSDGTVFFTASSFSVRNIPIALEIKEANEYRKRLQKEQELETQETQEGSEE